MSTRMMSGPHRGARSRAARANRPRPRRPSPPGLARAAATAAPIGSARPRRSQARWLSLIRTASWRPEPMVPAAAAPDRVLLQGPPAGRGLAGVEIPAGVPCDRRDEPRRERRDPAEPLEEIQRGPLQCQDRPHRAGKLRDHSPSPAGRPSAARGVQPELSWKWSTRRSTTGTPASTPAARATKRARPRAWHGIVAVEVMSPTWPRSSASARSISVAGIRRLGFMELEGRLAHGWSSHGPPCCFLFVPIIRYSVGAAALGGETWTGTATSMPLGQLLPACQARRRDDRPANQPLGGEDGDRREFADVRHLHALLVERVARHHVGVLIAQLLEQLKRRGQAESIGGEHHADLGMRFQPLGQALARDLHIPLEPQLLDRRDSRNEQGIAEGLGPVLRQGIAGRVDHQDGTGLRRQLGVPGIVDRRGDQLAVPTRRTARAGPRREDPWARRIPSQPPAPASRPASSRPAGGRPGRPAGPRLEPRRSPGQIRIGRSGRLDHQDQGVASDRLADQLGLGPGIAPLPVTWTWIRIPSFPAWERALTFSSSAPSTSWGPRTSSTARAPGTGLAGSLDAPGPASGPAAARRGRPGVEFRRAGRDERSRVAAAGNEPEAEDQPEAGPSQRASRRDRPTPGQPADQEPQSHGNLPPAPLRE